MIRASESWLHVYRNDRLVAAVRNGHAQSLSDVRRSVRTARKCGGLK